MEKSVEVKKTVDDYCNTDIMNYEKYFFVIAGMVVLRHIRFVPDIDNLYIDTSFTAIGIFIFYKCIYIPTYITQPRGRSVSNTVHTHYSFMHTS
jgi:hypothetical protein